MKPAQTVGYSRD